eukprot:TRINITY_DN70760_c0_g1_i1.p1 TRINITY_DN70760_c0_g1~~TRINITY_DN70760_c0_g1_i1.p1  ORF type:complete len:162 (-),score=23.28 TRINITY_DN70760_c0_g1_i1:450-935(-)
MRVVFLDIDGVLNQTRGATHIRLDEAKVRLFRQFVYRADVKIVLSTFWRAFGDYLGYILERYGISSSLIIGRTPGKGHFDGTAFDDAVYESRSEEIIAWLIEHPEVTNFVILDDRDSAGRGVLAEHFVHVTTEFGLSEDDVAAALSLLEKPRPEGLVLTKA